MADLELKFLGEFGVLRDGRAMPLPPSRKTRALLAYLGMNARRFRREHLCELLWEVPDDPRSSLRWSLSKLRLLLDDADCPRIVADRTHVGVDAADLAIDAAALQALVSDGLARAGTAALQDAAARYAGNFLEGLEFSNFHSFHAWCVAERERATRAQSALLRELVGRLADDPEQALPHARALVELAPYDEASRAALIRLLVGSQRIDEAEQQFQLGMRMLIEGGITSSGALLQARRSSYRAPRSEPPAAPVAAPEPGPVVAAEVDESLVGRDDEVRLVRSVMGDRAQQAAVLLIRGEPGMGKSRLLEVASELARAGDHRVLAASAFETGAIRPFGLWLDALRACCPEAAQRIFEEGRADNRERLFADLSELIAGEAGRRPVALLFDDIHWCDESSAAALHFVTRMNLRRPLRAVLAVREAELRDNMPLQQALRALRREGVLNEIRLGPLDSSAIARLVRTRAPGADSERLCHACGGNPLLAIELARAENDGDAGGSLEELVRERLARFDLAGGEVLRWAAVLNPRVDLAVLQRMTGLEAGAVGGTLEEAERQAILVSSERGLRFSHELVARAIYSEISPVRRQIMHRRVAEWIEQGLAPDLSHAAELAHHAKLSGDPGLAARAMVGAGRLCLRFFANDEALSLAGRGLQMVDGLPAAECVRVSIDLHDIVLASAALEDWEAAAEHYVDLAERALDHGALAHARLGYHMAAYVRWAHGQWAGAREQSLQSERVVRGGSDDEHVIGMAETAKCLVMLERDLSQADAMLMEAQSLALRGRIVHPAIPAGLGMLRFHRNELEPAEELFKQARTLCKSAGDRINEFQANEYLAMIDLQRGDFAAARRRCAELASIGDKLRVGSEAPFARALLGLCDYALDDDGGPLDLALAALRVADAKHRLGYVLTRAALVDLQRGRCEAAATRAGEALGCAELLESRSEMLLAHLALALCRRAAGDRAGAQAHCREVARLEAGGVAEWAREMAGRLNETGEACHG